MGRPNQIKKKERKKDEGEEEEEVGVMRDNYSLDKTAAVTNDERWPVRVAGTLTGPSLMDGWQDGWTDGRTNGWMAR